MDDEEKDLYVFASGNGGRHEDRCNFDGYTVSIYSVTVGAVDHTSCHPTYSEACAVLAAENILCVIYHSPSIGFFFPP